ncbi:protein kinase [Trypanosoma cruzi]|nr:protein kinase [Trypanosoma cruzi]
MKSGRGALFLSCRPRHAVHLALSAFSAILPSIMDFWVENTSLQGAANKGSSKSHALTWEPRRIYVFGLSRNTGILCPRTACGKPRRRHITRSCVYTSGLVEGVELAKGSGGVLWLEDPKVCHFVSNNISDPK